MRCPCGRCDLPSDRYNHDTTFAPYATSSAYASHEAATEARYGLEPRRIGGQAYDPDLVPDRHDLRDEL